MKLDKELYEKISKLTGTDYEALYTKNPDDEFIFIFNDSIENMLQDLLSEIDRLEEKIEDMDQDIEDNYRPIPVAEQVGISDKDFI